jgi:hypothetical protein
VRGWRADAMIAGWSTVVTAVLLGPLLTALGGGRYLLLRDAVSTPRSFVTDAALGLGGNAARATPQDWLLALASRAVDGGAVVAWLLVLILIAAAWGFARCALAVGAALGVPVGLPGAVTAATFALWNPYVVERLLQGHWSLLAGYAALGWTVVVALRLRGRRQIAGFAVCLAAGGLTPTGAVLVLVVALTVAVRRWRWLLPLFLCAAAPWLFPSLVSRSGVTVDPVTASVFAARAEPDLGTVGSVLRLGGIWNAQSVPDGAAWPFPLVVFVLVGGGLWVLRGALWRAPLRGLLLLGLVTAVLVTAAASGPGGTGLGWVISTVPGAGLLRDGQKWVALLMPLYSVCVAAAVSLVPRAARAGGVVAAVALCVAALPGAALGIGGALRPIQYPASWAAVASVVPADRGAVAVLPGGMLRVFSYGPAAPVLDPAPRMLRAPVPQTGELRVGGRIIDRVPGPAADAEQVLASGKEVGPGLARLGVGWVLVEASPDFPAAEPPGLDRVYDSADLRLYRVPGRIGPVPGAASSTERAGAWAAHLVWLAVLVGGAALLLRPKGQSNTSDQSNTSGRRP